MPLLFFQMTSDNTDLLPYFAILLSLLTVIALLQVYRSNKKLPQKLRAEDYSAFDYKITLFIKMALYILSFFSALTFVAAIGEFAEINLLDKFAYLLAIAFLGFGFSLILLVRESKRTPRSHPSTPVVPK